MKLQLVQATSQDTNLAQEKWMTPLNLIAISSYLAQYGIESEILDGLHLSPKQIIERLDGNMVGIHCNIFSTNIMDLYAKAAKSKGAFVFLGGDMVTPLAKQILNKNQNIDAIVMYDGENATKQIAEKISSGNKEFNNISNTLFRNPGEIITDVDIRRVSLEKMDFTTLPIPNRRMLDIPTEEYISSWQKNPATYAKDPTRRPTNTHTKKGCNRHCGFCGRMNRGIRARTPEQVFEEDNQLVKDFGVNYVEETSATYFSDMVWLKRLRKVFDDNGGLPVRYWAFANVEDITPESVEIMRDMNVYLLAVGIESGNEQIRKGINKHFTNHQVLEAAKLLGKAGIRIEDSYIIGLPGENETSVKETYQLSQQVSEICNSENRGFSLIIPLPGSTIWNDMMKIPYLRKKYGDEYNFDIEELRKDYITNFCNI